MKRISGHSIDPAHTSKLKPVPLKICYYIDGYGAKLSSEVLYDIGDKRLHEHLRSQDGISAAAAEQLYDKLYTPPTPEIFAEILSYSLALIELYVISTIEDRMRARGTPVYPNALLVNKSNPLNLEINGKTWNILETLYPIREDEFLAENYLDISSDGTIYSTGKVDRDKQVAILKRELENCRRFGDTSRIAWLEKNVASVRDGKFHYRNRDGSIGRPVDFEFSEAFYDAVSDRIGYYSRLGESKIHWRQDLSDFGEKGVDCDLIMQVMDDLYQDNVDVFVFMTNDMDFFPLIERLVAKGKSVFICGIEGRVSYRLINAVGEKSFFNLKEEPILQNLPNVFMALDKPELREVALQWAWLALRRKVVGEA